MNAMLVRLLPVLLLLPFWQSAQASQTADAGAESVRAVITELVAKGDRYRKAKNAAAMDSAIGCYDSAIALTESAFGASDTAVATCLNGLGKCYYWQRDFERGEAANRKAIEIWENALGPDHPSVARGLRGLADFYAWKTSRYADAEKLYLRAIDLLEDAPGTYRLDFALTLTCLGELCVGLDRFTEAESILRRAVDTYSELPGSQIHIQFLPLLVLGAASVRQEKYDEAESYILRARDNIAQLHGEDHYYMSSVYRHLANIYAHQGRYEEATTAAERAIRIVENEFGNEHYELIPRLQNLANAELGSGNLSGAQAASERAVRIAKKAYGVSHPMVSSSLGHLAKMYAAASHEGSCLAAYCEMVESRREFVSEIFAHASEDQKLQYFRRFPVIDDSFISFALSDDNPDSHSASFNMLLHGKALIIDAVSAERQVAYCTDDEHLQALVQDHGDVCRLIANMTLAKPGGGPQQSLKDTLEVLYNHKDRIEADLSGLCAEFEQRQSRADFTIADVAQALPDRGTLVEFVRYRPYRFDAQFVGQPWGPPNYAAFTFDPHGRLTLRDLGVAGTIDSLIAVCHAHLQSAPTRLLIDGMQERQVEAQLADITRRLYDHIFAPLQETLGDRTRLLISPDGALNLLPFELLQGSDDKYLIENYEISYLTSGRDLLERRELKVPPNGLVAVFANPDYDVAPAEPIHPISASEYKFYVALPIRGTANSMDCLANLFPPLPAAQAEGQTTVNRLNARTGFDVQYFQGAEASEGRLESLSGPPAVLHLATHGYFCQTAQANREPVMAENPLLYSGLAMAGANRLILRELDADRETDDGILTALEASAMNLQGTELVVLSACHSGMGQVVNGEGVFGLRRAFQHAGAQSLVMSMFAVPDDATIALMERFYDGWLAGSRKAEALRNAALAVLRERREQHGAAYPLFWGGFVLLGDPN
jgi:CHAT domain-containing protein/tetratricopeptide (TPR) repeat protein